MYTHRIVSYPFAELEQIAQGCDATMKHGRTTVGSINFFTMHVFGTAGFYQAVKNPNFVLLRYLKFDYMVNYEIINNEKNLQFEIHEDDEMGVLQYRFYKNDIALMH